MTIINDMVVEQRQQLEALRRRYVDACLAGGIVAAEAVLDQARQIGMTSVQLYLQVLTPALVLVGERWLSGDLTVSQEHIVSNTSLELAGRVRIRIPKNRGMATK
jgi:methanogenic corrinoid protein MtbC1